MHIYAFGSICRGDISVESDIDLLALVEGRDSRLDPNKFSIYSYSRMKELWESGNAFAWHLAIESKLIYSEDGNDFINQLGAPSKYEHARSDCERFREIFDSAFLAISEGTPSIVFELSTIFLSIRNIATCYSLSKLQNPTFGRNSARRLGSKSVPLSDGAYSDLMRARILSTRGVGDDLSDIDMHKLMDELVVCRRWMNSLYEEVDRNG